MVDYTTEHLANDMEDDSQHPLLEPLSPAYSNVTVRRAFVVWMYCGQRNSFKDVCDYYHHLEAMEDKLPANRRATSRQHEFQLFSNAPPTSSFLAENYPTLYHQSVIQDQFIQTQNHKHERFVPRLEDCRDFQSQNGATTEEIFKTSQLIRMYCQSRSISVNKFLSEFKIYARKCNLANTIQNIVRYIKQQLMQEDLELEHIYTKVENFLENLASDDNFGENVTYYTNKINSQLDNFTIRTILDNGFKTLAINELKANSNIVFNNIWAPVKPLHGQPYTMNSFEMVLPHSVA